MIWDLLPVRIRANNAPAAPGTARHVVLAVAGGGAGGQIWRLDASDNKRQ